MGRRSRRHHRGKPQREGHESTYNHQLKVGDTSSREGRCLKHVDVKDIPDAVCFRTAGHELLDDLGCDANISVRSFVETLKAMEDKDG